MLKPATSAAPTITKKKAMLFPAGVVSGVSTHESRGLGELRDCSSSNGLQQSGYFQNGCPRQDSTGANALERNSDPGKILRRLKLIEAKYSNYVDNHQKQLETQLTESKAHKVELTQEIADLEQEIYNLISDSPENKQE